MTIHTAAGPLLIALGAVSAAAQTSPVADTGQATCYDHSVAVACPEIGAPFAGQDAQHEGHQPSYVVSADGLTVSDGVTGLVWQRSPDTDGDGDVDAADAMTFADAAGHPAVLNAQAFGGFDDWRLPTLGELYSLIDFRGTDASGFSGTDTTGLAPFLDTEAFVFAYGDTAAGDRVIDAQYVSATAYAADAGKVFGVNFADGRIKGYDLSTPTGDATFYVRCVRGNPAYGTAELVADGDGTVRDLASGLMWSQADAGATMDWESALAWAAARNGEGWLGYDDWRLPNAKELQSLVDYGRSPDATASAAVDPLLETTAIVNEAGATDWPCFWSSTTHVTHTGSARAAAYVCFGRALGWMRPGTSGCYNLVDIHGAGAQRADPKTGDPAGYALGTACSGGTAYGHGPQGDVVRMAHGVRLVRDGASDLFTDGFEDGDLETWSAAVP